ncbi:hypothetical protein [Novosphingobium guangzhouense]|uniref:Uncharacterized protein n=1 Tax=Novosphingobium guangzhouense TaxID=1850347 RepID=A0A2K2FUP3_9SPHN|nr:hypothetical protein [Novosphingobium guangzhouense]PNU02505.1 hypothetical protein A8V01_08980 [Novosphingobium guangzhouense]
MSVQSDLGPSMPPRIRVYQVAYDVERLAHLARELASTGPGGDVRRALAKLEEARGMLADFL